MGNKNSQKAQVRVPGLVHEIHHAATFSMNSVPKFPPQVQLDPDFDLMTFPAAHGWI